MSNVMSAAPRVQIVAVSCSGCDWSADLEIPQPATMGYLHDNEWEHTVCGGRIQFATEPARLTLAILERTIEMLREGRTIGLSVEDIEQIRLVQPAEPEA